MYRPRTLPVWGSLLIALASAARGDEELLIVRADFSDDPGWDWHHNRIECRDPPTRRMDFGWSPTNHTGAGPGELGGTMWRSRTPAWYGLPIGPFTLKDRLAASGRIALRPGREIGGGYFGFFNSTRQEWRPWSAMAIRLGDENRAAELYVDYMTGTWKANYLAVDERLPADGSVHTWKFAYDPDRTVAAEWPNPRLKEYLTTGDEPEDVIFERARAHDPDLTREALRRALEEALDLGLVEWERSSRVVKWNLRRDPAGVKGQIAFQLDDGRVYRQFLMAGHQDEPTVFDRFGLFNMQVPGRSAEFYLGDLVVNGRRIELAADPGWEGRSNRREFVERDFHPRQNFGYSRTHHAGQAAGEIGGTCWRTEPEDPYHAYYADEVGRLTLDDPLEFSGSVAFTGGETDAGMFFGYFNAAERRRVYERGARAQPSGPHLGIEIEGPTRVGYFFAARGATSLHDALRADGPIFPPTGDRRRFTFRYDPTANDGRGRVEWTLDDQTFALDLTEAQRRAGAVFDRFGIANLRAGGKSVTVWFDDLAYTARRDPAAPRPFHPQGIVTIPYPEGGRRY